jgi:hypothetical protein
MDWKQNKDNNNLIELEKFNHNFKFNLKDNDNLIRIKEIINFYFVINKNMLLLVIIETLMLMLMVILKIFKFQINLFYLIMMGK